MKQLMPSTTHPLNGKHGGSSPNAADVPTLLGDGSFSLLDSMWYATVVFFLLIIQVKIYIVLT